eukprot:g1071.t1
MPPKKRRLRSWCPRRRSPWFQAGRPPSPWNYRTRGAGRWPAAGPGRPGAVGPSALLWAEHAPGAFWFPGGADGRRRGGGDLLPAVQAVRRCLLRCPV